MKKCVSVLLAVLLLAGFCATAFADDTVYTEGYFYYTVEDGSITIVGYFGNETEVTIPASIAGVPVNAVAPGVIDTDMSSSLVDVQDEIRKSIPMRRFGTAAEVAAVVSFLFRDEAAYVTRQVISVNGGLI